jgi:hypothetical protein
MALLPRPAPRVTEGIVFEIGKELAAETPLVKKAVQVLRDAEEPIGQFLSDMPADIRMLKKVLLNSLKNDDHRGVPLPKMPRIVDRVLTEERREDD